MRIAAYTALNGYYNNPTGVGKHIVQMLLGLRERGHAVSLVAAKSEQQVGALHDHPLGELPINYIPWHRRALEWSWLLAGRPNVDCWINEPDWVYTGYEVPIRVRKARLAATIHSMYWFDSDCPGYYKPGAWLARARWWPVFRQLAHRADVLLTVSEFVKTQIVEWLKVPSNRVIVVGNGVEQEYFKAGASLGGHSNQNHGQPFLICVGGLNDLDGARYTLNVAKELKRAGSNLRILIAGTQNDPAYLSETSGLGNVELLGYVDRKRLCNLMRDSMALLYLNRYESFGMGAAEAMAAGTPVIATSFTAVPEVVGDAAICVNPCDATSIVETLLSLQTQSGLRDNLIQKGKARAKNYTWAACVSRLQAALEQR